jgi:nitrogen-specific signal transduction histidine kinase/HAMP domain-containing protein
MRQFFRQLKVKQKIFVLLAIAIFFVFIANTFSHFWIASTNPVQKHITSLYSLVLNTQDKKSSKQWLEFLNKNQKEFEITSLAIYNKDSELVNTTDNKFPDNLKNIKMPSSGNGAILLPVKDHVLLIKAEPHIEHIFLIELIILNFIAFCIGLFLVYIVLYFITRLIIRPIFSLTNTTNEIAMEQNYALRAERFYSDEIGTLAENFNFMLNRIEQDDYILRQERDKAEQARLRAIELSTKMHDANERLEFEVKVRARVEHKLTDFQHYLNNIIDSMPSAIIAIDHELKVTQWNKGATAITLIDRDDAIYQPLEESCGFLFPYLNLITSSLEKHLTNKVERIQYNNGQKDSFVDMTIYPLLDTTRLGAVIRIDDVTQRIQMEDMMVQSEKMLSLGGLAAGMAHEINNPLGAVVQTVQNIKRRLDPNLKKNIEAAKNANTDLATINAYMQQREILSFLDNVSKAGERAATIVKNMLQFSRKSDKELKPQNLHHIIERSINIAKNEYDLSSGYDFKSIDLIKNFDYTMPDVPCISSEIEQVLLNLLKNASQALTEYKSQKEFDMDWYSQIQIYTRAKAQNVEIIIEDNGPGMDDETAKHIFEPFFTTKDVGMGTGLGLSVSFFIITNHHQGQMRVESTLGAGTRFKLTLPHKQSRDKASSR